MKFWAHEGVLTVLILAALLLLAALLRRLVPQLRQLAIPSSIIAGLVALGLGPSALAVLPLHTSLLESAVYHGLAIAFIAVSLQTPPPGRTGGGATSMAFAIPWLLAFQAAIGLSIVLLMGGLHPGLAALLPLGFQQGPGQALSMGSTWEAFGLQDGGQLGLIIAAIGFGWSILFGVPLVHWGRRRGLISPAPASELAPQTTESKHLPAGALDVLTRQVVAIAVIYLITYGVVLLLAQVPALSKLVWGFHFLVGTLIALPARGLINKLPGPSPLDDALLGRLAGITVDIITCSALAAIQIAVLTANWLPIVVLTTVCGVLTLLAVVWFSSRAFPQAPFEHGVVLFGTATGTLPMGLALLRIIDPDMRSPAPISAVLGSVGAILGGAPVVMLMLPTVVTSWSQGSYPSAGWMWLAISLAYAIALTVGWRLFGPLRFRRPLTALWPTDEQVG